MASVVIRPRFDVRNREYKRKFTAEARKILPLLWEINDNFINDLFDEENSADYMDLYYWYKAKWEDACEYFIRNGKAVHCMINTKLFENLYKPQL
jgi:hypothetical protein